MDRVGQCRPRGRSGSGRKVERRRDKPGPRRWAGSQRVCWKVNHILVRPADDKLVAHPRGPKRVPGVLSMEEIAGRDIARDLSSTRATRRIEVEEEVAAREARWSPMREPRKNEVEEEIARRDTASSVRLSPTRTPRQDEAEKEIAGRAAEHEAQWK